MNENVLKFLLESDYYVQVFIEKENSYVAMFPSNIHLEIPEQMYQYYILGNEIIVVRVNDKKTKTIEVEDFELRPLILSDILIKTSKRKIPVNLIITTKDSNRIRLYDILPKPENIEKEELLLKFANNYLTGIKDYSIIENNKLQSSFDKFINIYDSEGIL